METKVDAASLAERGINPMIGGTITEVPRAATSTVTTAGAITGASMAAAQPGLTTTVLDAQDIFAPLEPVTWLCKDLGLAPGAPSLWAGYGYTGKTVSAQSLALSVATGTKIWGLFQTRLGSVLHVDYEQGAHLTRLRYQRLARGLRIDPRELVGRLALVTLPAWYLDGDSRELERLVDGVDLVIFDSLRAACPHTDENSSEARAPLDYLMRLSERTGAHIMILHHARKPSLGGGTGGARMAMRGSGALYDACGSAFVFTGKKGEPVTVAHEKARITGQTHGDFQLRVEDVQIDGDPTGGLRVVAVDAPPVPASAPPGDALKARIYARVQSAGVIEGSLKTISAMFGNRNKDVSGALKELVAAGLLEKGGAYRKPTYTLVLGTNPGGLASPNPIR